MRTRFVVCYDIADPGRLRRVHSTLRGYGDWMQFSIFSCELSERERVKLGALLDEQIDHAADQVLFIDVGPAEGRAEAALWRSAGRSKPRAG